MTGACARDDAEPHVTATGKKPASKRARALAGQVDPGALLEARIAERYDAAAWRRSEAAQQALSRARRILAGAASGIGGLREGWVIMRHGATVRPDFTAPQSGAEMVGDHGARDAGPQRPGQAGRAGRAIARYDEFAEHRPPGWPQSGAAALLWLAAQQRADTLEGDIARLRILAADMRAAALHADAPRLEHARGRAQRRDAGYPPRGAAKKLMRFSFRKLRSAVRFETPEQRRLHVRDDLLLRGEHPGLSAHVFTAAYLAACRHDAGDSPTGDPAAYALPDGMTARAQRYERQVAAGAWEPPARALHETAIASEGKAP